MPAPERGFVSMISCLNDGPTVMQDAIRAKGGSVPAQDFLSVEALIVLGAEITLLEQMLTSESE